MLTTDRQISTKTPMMGSVTMNEHLQERLGRGGAAWRPASAERTRIEVSTLPPRLNSKIMQYHEAQPTVDEGSQWQCRPEIPTDHEILDHDGAASGSDSAVEILPNKPVGAWLTKEEYLSTHYELLREQAVRPMREAVAVVRSRPGIHEDAFEGPLKNQVGLYDRIRVSAIKTCTLGVAARVTFSLIRIGKQVVWEQSKRLRTGSLVVLLPKIGSRVTDSAIVATVAARPVRLLLQNPPELYLFFAAASAFEIDPAKEFLLVEAKSTFFEAERYTMTSLQRMSSELFPLNEHLVHIRSDVGPPAYIQNRSKLNLSSVFGPACRQVDILEDWPKEFAQEMDASQLGALSKMLGKRLALVQGPPGTGKTWVSVQALKIMLGNWRPKDPPIIVLAQTNHAVDQIVRHVLQFETQLVRLGGQSKDTAVKQKTLYEARNQYPSGIPAGSQLNAASAKMRALHKEIQEILLPLQPSKSPLDLRLLEEFRILSAAQVGSLVAGAHEWQIAEPNTDPASSAFEVWLGDALLPVPEKALPETYDFPYETVELELEDLSESEREAASRDDELFESLHGPDDIKLCDNFTCRKTPAARPFNVADMLRRSEDLWDIPTNKRPSIYSYLQSEMKRCIRDRFRLKVSEYNKHAALRKVGRAECDENILKEQKIIAMTTTGFSKYRGLISALSPRIVLCEEAAEVLEAPITATCVPSLEQLILVGDHRQLRPSTNCRALEDKPYYFNISLFERLINNELEFTTLETQRRMIPEVRRLLRPIYQDQLKDHESVKSRQRNVPGMGGVNSFWFCHEWRDAQDDLMSSYNEKECNMVCGFVEYLVKNGVKPAQITCLTFYNGQRKALSKKFRRSEALTRLTYFPKVVTVDSYQGEENEIVLLSLVRSNDTSTIGFLSNANRTCVALSRARCGFYIFGNGSALYTASTLWKEVITIFAGRGSADVPLPVHSNRLDNALPITCTKHGIVSRIRDPGDWSKHERGGCPMKCAERLSCGHSCQLDCHPYDHVDAVCSQCPRPSSRSPKKGKQRPEISASSSARITGIAGSPPKICNGTTDMIPAATQDGPAQEEIKESMLPAGSSASLELLIDYDGADDESTSVPAACPEAVYAVVTHIAKIGPNGQRQIKERSLATFPSVSPIEDWSHEPSLLDDE